MNRYRLSSRIGVMHASMIIAMLSGFLTCVSAKAAGPKIARASVQARLDQLQNLSSTYTLKVETDFDPALPVPEHGTPPLPVEVDSGQFSYLRGAIRIELEPTKETLAALSKRPMGGLVRKEETRTMDGRCEELTEWLRPRKADRKLGGISADTQFPEAWTIDLGLGLRLYREQQWLTKAVLAQAKEIPSKDPNIFILEIAGKNGLVHELHFDKSHMYALTYYRGTWPTGSFEEIINSQFRFQDGIDLPFKILRRSTYLDSAGKVRHPFTRTVTVEQYKIRDPQNAPERYSIAWPAGMELFDARVGRVVDVGPTTRPLSDADIRRQLNRTGHAVNKAK